MGNMIGTSRYKSDYSQLDPVIQRMQDQAAGKGPSVAQEQANILQNQATGNMLGTIAAQKSLSPSERANLAGTQTARMQSDAAAQGGLLRAAEQMEANKTLADMLMNKEKLNQNAFNEAQQRRAGIVSGIISGAASAYTMGGKGAQTGKAAQGAAQAGG